MSAPYHLRLVLRSGATFGRGVRTPAVDVDTDHDAETGLPYVRRSVVRGLIVEGCADVLYALETREARGVDVLAAAAGRLFGRPGSRAEDEGALYVGRAELPAPYRRAVAAAVAERASGALTPGEALAAHAVVRASTAVEAESEAAAAGTLRTSRVVHRGTAFWAPLDPGVDLADEDATAARAVLGAAVAAVRRAGWRRSRGRGRLHRLEVHAAGGGGDLVGTWLDDFEGLVGARDE